MSQLPLSQSEAPPAPIALNGVAWMRQNLFNSWFNSVLTGICLVLIYLGVRGAITWLSQAQWQVLQVNLKLFFVGFYPPELVWRLWLIPALVAGLGGLSGSPFAPTSKRGLQGIAIGFLLFGVLVLALPLSWSSRLWLLGISLLAAIGFGTGQKIPALASWLPWLWVLSFPVVLWLIGGGLGLKSVESSMWTGLLLTLLLAVVSIFLAFPLGVLLDLGRRSDLPVVRSLSTLYIEIVRGLPLIGILFIAQVMLPLFLPQRIRPDPLIRAIAGLVIFSAAYLAEVMRGGLQSIPKGQGEAAKALGLSSPLTMLLIVLPQALRNVLPAIVGQFISLFKDTSLLAIFSLVELTGVSRSVLAQPEFQGRYAEVYLFAGALYWVFCYSMSQASRRLERSGASRR